MKSYKMFIRLISAITFLYLLLPHALCLNGQENPTESVKTMVTMIRNHQYNQALSNIDLEGLSQYCLSKYWNEQSSENKNQFIKLLSDLLINVAFKKSTDFFNDLEITYGEENINANDANVLTFVEHPDEGEIEIEYRLHFNNKEWRVYDVLLDGASLASNLRSQMTNIIEQKSFDELITKMSEKLQENNS
ncbi:MAG: ABC transporter substrate-binding protein [Chlamydiota bacterium]|nr:ABC transporter substrate-binding protein [Chlamydiota bacterium]